jgi:peptidyl-prolyl cis-trans isomerase-like 4
VLLELIGDLPDVDAKPPDESLFVCRLNPVTTDEDLEIIFSRFGKVETCDIIRDHQTGDSLNFAFVSFATKEDAETAYFKMDNALIDDRRVRVDFSQSMHSLWKNYRRFGRNGGAKHDSDRAYLIDIGQGDSHVHNVRAIGANGNSKGLSSMQNIRESNDHKGKNQLIATGDMRKLHERKRERK